ncbi:MAG: phenylalanine--tRNA ligase subunit beta [bacterium]|nr:phenylalanine--tRNA ligase subunit beta [bacterium]
MLLSLNWLKEFVEIPKNLTPEELGEKLTMHTVEVEKVSRQADKYKGVAVGKILEVKPHPNADRLRLAKVDVGREKLEIVCGAPNIAAGQFVPVALVGAALPNGLVIKPAEIRGVKSNGMLCAPDELGLGEDHAGIMILKKAEPGMKFSDYLKLNDVIFEVDNKSITHRADLWSHYGLARDISAFLNTKFKQVKTPLIPLYKGDKPLNPPFKRGAGGLNIKVKVEDFKLCPRYMALAMTGVKVAPSPKWMQDRLLACGTRSINNIVDITNYVMLELGQPLHAFDKNFIDKIIVRRAKAGETMETLDGIARKLEPEMLVIADSHQPVAVAGIMGGANSEINADTTSIIIEAANFDFTSVRKTAQKLGLRTEASMRFEKGLDPTLCELGLARAAELIKQLCPGAKAVGKLADEKQTPLIPLLKGDKRGLGPINLDLNWLNQYIGENFSAKQVKQILEKLGFGVKIRTLGVHMDTECLFSVIIPTWRAVHDVSLPEDLAEEVARIYGYNNIKASLPKADAAPPEQLEERILIRQIKNILSVGAKMAEVYNYSFVSEEQLKKLTPQPPFQRGAKGVIPLSKGGEGGLEVIKLVNPLSEDLAVLRPSLIPGLLENIKTNQAQEPEIALYEIGRIFLNQPGADELPWQEKYLALALAGNESEDLFRKLKGVIGYLLKELNLEAEFEAVKAGTLGVQVDTECLAEVYANGQAIGQVMELENNSARALGLKKPAALAEISLAKLFAAVKNNPARQYAEPPKYPAAVRDLAFVVNEKILYNKVVKQIKNFSSLIKQAELFDIYQGDKLGAGKKNLAFHIIYQADRTLTSAEIDAIQSGLVKHLEKEIGAKVRDF